MSPLREIAYRLDPALWVKEVLEVRPRPWQERFLRAPRGAQIAALTGRQGGKSTTAGWALSHAAIFQPGSLSVVVCPAQRQSSELVRRVREAVLKAGGTFRLDNVFAVELDNGSRVLALPGSDDSVRGLTVDAWIVADEAARLSPDLIAALRPMRAQKPTMAMYSSYVRLFIPALSHDRENKAQCDVLKGGQEALRCTHTRILLWGFTIDLQNNIKAICD